MKKDDYKLEAERMAYNRGLIASINGLNRSDCPYILKHNIKCWLAGFSEKASIDGYKEETKQKECIE